MKEKVVLAYSGGLDTTAIIPWLKETFNYDVICCCIDCGQGEELDGLEERAKLSGAAKLYIEDIVDDFADNYIAFRHMPYTKMNIFSELPWPVLQSQNVSWKLHGKKMLLPSATVLPVKEMTRSVLNLVSQHLLRTSKSLLLGE